MELINFTDCPIDRIGNYGGSDKKRGIIYEGKRYMLKFSDQIPEEKRNSLNSSYSNSSYSEYVGCHIASIMGFDVQNTLLGTIDIVSPKGKFKSYPVVACENFIPEGKTLVEFKMIENALLDTKPSKTPQIQDIYEIMLNENIYFTEAFGKEALEQYWDVFIFDALLGIFDRHANNWGYLVDNETKDIGLAPIYDCGSCLYPQIADEAVPKIISSPEMIKERIDVFPKAALIVDGQKVAYKDYILSLVNDDCTKALLRIAPKIDLNAIEKFINSVDGLTSIRKQLYIVMIKERYEQIIAFKVNNVKLFDYEKEGVDAMEKEKYISDEAVVKRANAAVKIELEKKKAMDIPAVIYDRSTQIIYSESSDGSRVEIGKRMRKGRYSERIANKT